MRTLGARQRAMVLGAVAAWAGAAGPSSAGASLPPYTVTRVYSSSTNVEGVHIASPFNGGSYGGPGFNSVAVSNSGRAYVHVNLYGEPPPPPLEAPVFHNNNQAVLFTGASGFDTTPFLYGGAGYDGFAPTNGSVTAPSANYIYDEGFATAVNNNDVGAFTLRLGARATNLVTPITGLYFGKTAMPVKEGDAVTAAGFAPGTVFGAFGPARLMRYPETSPGAVGLTGSVQLNDNNVFLFAGEVVESGVSRRAIMKVVVDGAGVLISETLVAKEGGPVGAGPSAWITLATTANTCAINNAGEVIFSGVTSAGVSGIYKVSGAGVGQFVAVGGGAGPTGALWAPLAGAPVDLNNGGQYAFRGIALSGPVWTEVGDAGETFGSQAGSFPPTTNITQGGGALTTIGGVLSSDTDVDVYQIKVGDPTLPVQEAFSATTVPNPGTGFAGAGFDTVLYLFSFNFQNNGDTRAAVGRCDDTAAGVVQSTLTAASLQTSTHNPGDAYFLAVSTPKARATNSGLGAAPFPEIWQSVPGRIAVSGGVAYWVDPAKGQIGRASVATGALLTPLQVGAPPQHLRGFQGDQDVNSKVLDQKIAVYEAGAGSKIYFQQHGYGDLTHPYEVIRTCNLDGSGLSDLGSPSGSGVSAIAFDSVNSKFYWAKSVAGGTAEVHRSDPTGGNAETVVSIVDTMGFGEKYIVDSLAVDTAGAGKVYWVQTVYDPTVPLALPGVYIRRANLDGTGVQTVVSNAKASSLAVDVPARRLYYTSNQLNKVAWIDMTLAGPTFPVNTLATSALPLGIAVDSGAGKVYWSNPSERMIRRSAATAPATENWLSIGRDIGEVVSDGPAYLDTLSTFVRDGASGGVALPYQIRLTGATFGVQGAVICKNGTSVVAQVGQPLPGTSNVVAVAGTPDGPVRIGDDGNVAWIGTATVRGVFLNSDNVVNTATQVAGGDLGTADITPGAMDMSSNGRYIVVTSGSGPVMLCTEIAFTPDAAAGACCDARGGCLALTAGACAAAGAGFLGAGSACVPDPCPQPGACCAGSTCSVGAPGACAGVFTRFAGANTACNAGGNGVSPCCKADYNQSGGVTVQDIFDFLGGYFTQDGRADVNGAGGVTVQDIFDYLALYFVGCS